VGCNIGEGCSIGAWCRIGAAATIRESMIVEKTVDIIQIGLIGSRNAMLTVSRNGFAATGCFCGTLERFRSAVREKHAGTSHETVYVAALDCAIAYFKATESQGAAK